MGYLKWHICLQICCLYLIVKLCDWQNSTETIFTTETIIATTDKIDELISTKPMNLFETTTEITLMPEKFTTSNEESTTKNYELFTMEPEETSTALMLETGKN